MFDSTDRAIALGVAEFIAILVVAGLLFVAFNSVVPDVISAASGHTSDSTAQSHVDLMDQIWGLILFFVVFVAGMFLIARSTFESRGP